MRLLRDMLYGLVIAVTSPVWGLSMLRSGKWRTDWRGRFGHVSREGSEAAIGLGGRRTVMIHAVSLGEVNATREMVRRLDEELGDQVRIVITATTNTGFDRAKELYGDKLAVLRYPFDFSRSVGRFLDAVRPDVVALVELEVWPNFVEACVRRSIPVCVVNGRLSERSFRRYRPVRWLMRRSFASLAKCGVQTAAYRKRFIGMGAAEDRVIITDSMKWDTAKVMEPTEVKGVDEMARAMGIDRGKPVVVAGSTGPGEEALLLKGKPAGVQLVLAPRKPERFEEVAGVIEGWSGETERTGAKPPAAGVVRRSRHADGAERAIDGTEVFLLDTMGELRKAYALADVVIVGRSLIDLYGSDPIEPIALGRPTLIGPRYGDFTDIVETFNGEEGIIVTDQPWKMASELLKDRERARQLAVNGRRVILSRQGATERHVRIVKDVLNNMKA